MRDTFPPACGPRRDMPPAGIFPDKRKQGALSGFPCPEHIPGVRGRRPQLRRTSANATSMTIPVRFRSEDFPCPTC